MRPTVPVAGVPAIRAGYQVGHGVVLPLGDPADQREQQPAEGRRVEHGGRVYPMDGTAEATLPSADQCDTTRSIEVWDRNDAGTSGAH